MNIGKKFWRLLGDYETLSTDEGVALREINLAAIARLQEKKTVVTEAILQIAAKAGLTVPPERLRRLIAQQHENLAVAQTQIARILCEKENVAAAGQRLTHVGRAYRRRSNGKAAFQAKG